jgi:transcriptional regulator with XRE-family HTH domain
MKPEQKFCVTDFNIAEAIGKTIADTRQKNKLTQQNLADSVHLSVQQIQKYEYGETNISIARLIEIADTFDICVLELLKPVLARHYKIDEIFYQSLKNPLDIELAKLVQGFDLKRKQNLLNLLTN